MAGGADVLIVGGGIIGLSIAREAARAGLAVRVLEKGRPGCEASEAAAGMLAPQVEADLPASLRALAVESRDLYPAFVEAVREESGIDPGLLEDGTILLARDAPREIADLERHAGLLVPLGLPFERLGPDDLRRLEPSLNPGFAAGLLLPRDVSVDNALLVRALHVAAARAGARIDSGACATRLVVERGRVVGVESGGLRLEAESVVVAAGAWSGEIVGPGLPALRTHPVRGQMVCLDPHGLPLRRILCAADGYLVRRRDGRLLAGSTMEKVGFDKRVSASGVAGLVGAAIGMVPSLADAPVLAMWAGLRPATDDGLPAIGPGPAPGLLYACGHFRNGILLAPVTALILCRLLRGERPGMDLAPFSPLRLMSSDGPSSPAPPGNRP